MTVLNRIRRTCPRHTAVILACLVMIPLTGFLETVTVGMRFCWFFTRCLLAVLAFYHALSICIHFGLAEKVARCLRWLIRIGTAVWLTTFFIALGCIVAFGQPDQADDVPFITVLGAGLNGTEPSLILKNRLDRAIELSQTYPEATLILCGGQSEHQVISEAEAMRRYLVRNGVDESRLVLEEQSRDTAENLKYACALMDQLEGTQTHKSYLVTCSFHMMRSKLLAERYGIEPYAAPVKTRPQEYHYYIREYFSLLIYLVEQTGITLDTSAWNL